MFRNVRVARNTINLQENNLFRAWLSRFNVYGYSYASKQVHYLVKCRLCRRGMQTKGLIA